MTQVFQQEQGLAKRRRRRWRRDRKIEGGCHCGDVRFEATVDDALVTVLDCACEIAGWPAIFTGSSPNTASC
jgi:hypothetical protein